MAQDKFSTCQHVYDAPDEEGVQVCMHCGRLKQKPKLYPANPEEARKEVCKLYYQNPITQSSVRLGHPEPVENYRGKGFKYFEHIPAVQEADRPTHPEYYQQQGLPEIERSYKRAQSFHAAVTSRETFGAPTTVRIPEGFMASKKHKYHQIIDWLHENRVLYSDPFTLNDFCGMHDIPVKPTSQAFFILVRSGLLKVVETKSPGGKRGGRTHSYQLAKAPGSWSVQRAVVEYKRTASAYSRENDAKNRVRKEEERRQEEARLAKQRAAAEQELVERETALAERVAALEEREQVLRERIGNGTEAVRVPTPNVEVAGVNVLLPDNTQHWLPDEFAIKLRDWLLVQYPVKVDLPEPKIPTFRIDD